MMRSPNCLAVAVRTPQGKLIVRQRPWISLATRWRFLRWPFMRGILVLGESLHNGLSALNFSASVQELGQQEGKPAIEAKERQASLWITVAVAVVMALALFAALPHFLTWGVGWLVGSDDLSGGRSFSFHLVDGIIKLAIFIGYIKAISLLPEIARVFAYHGAEHKGIYAYENGQALTVDNARDHTTLHPRCGTAFLLVVLLTAVVAFTVIFPFVPPVSELALLNHLFFVFIKLLLLFPLAGLAYEVIRLAGRRPASRLLRLVLAPGLFMQRLTTREPDDSQLEVSIASLRTVLRSEREFLANPQRPAVERQDEYGSFDEFAAQCQEVS